MAYDPHSGALIAFEQVLTSGARRMDGMAERLAQHRAYRETLSELRALCDRELTDLGMHRAGLKSIAAEAVHLDTAF